MTAAHSGPLVVFVIGMRINHFHKVGKWLAGVPARWVRCWESLIATRPSGFLGYRIPAARALRTGGRCCNTGAISTAWRPLPAPATRSTGQPGPRSTRPMGSDGTVGIFHETYVVPEHASETIYANMVLFGLGKVSGMVPATGSRNAGTLAHEGHIKPKLNFGD